MFGKETKFIVSVFGEAPSSKTPKAMGNASFEIGEVLAARGSTKAKQLRDGGTLYVGVTRATTVNNRGVVRGKFHGIKLKNMDGFLHKSDPFYTISSQIDAASSQTWQAVYRSEVIKNNLDPVWNSFVVSLDNLCGGNKDVTLRIQVSDWDKGGKHRAIGSVDTTVNALLFMMGDSERKLPLLLNKKKPSGFLQLDFLHLTGENTVSTSTDDGVVPPKFIKVNGINKMNPEYQKWKATQPATQPQDPPARPNRSTASTSTSWFTSCSTSCTTSASFFIDIQSRCKRALSTIGSHSTCHASSRQ